MPGAAVPYAVYRGAALPGDLGRSEKNRGASDGGGPNNRGEANIYGRFKGGYIDSTIIIYGRYYLWEI